MRIVARLGQQVGLTANAFSNVTPRSGSSDSSAFSIVVLPAPLRPMSTIFSPRLTMPLKPSMTGVPS